MPETLAQPSILLVEEYDGLAAAIGSALRKFAPAHARHVARTFAEADRVVRENAPEVVLLDLDPPLPHTIEFLTKLQANRPEARVLVLTGAPALELDTAAGRTGALRFIEKPFRLEEFGAIIGSLLGPATIALAGNPRRTVRDLHVIDTVHLQCLCRASAILKVIPASGQTGEIHFADGEIVHAGVGKLKGAEALQTILSWKGTTFTETERPSDGVKTIEGEWRLVFAEAVRSSCEPRKSRAVAAAAEPPEIEVPKTGRKILIIDDTEMLLVFVADVLSLGDPDFQITAAATGSEGLKIAATTLPDIILLDYSLPDINGDEVCERLLADPATARIPVVMMSGHVPEMNAAAMKFENVAAAIAKPFLSAALVSVVEGVLAKPWNSEPEKSAPAAPPSEPMAPAPPPDVVERKKKPHANGNGANPDSAHVKSPVLLKPALPEPALKTSSPVAAVVPVPLVPPLGIPLPKVEPVTIPRIIPPLVLPSVQAVPKIAGEQVSDKAVTSAEVFLTVSLEILALQLTPDFRVGSLQLKTRDQNASLRVPPGKAHGALALETGFEMGAITLADGGVETLRLIPRPRSEITSNELPSEPPSASSPGEPIKVQMAMACDLVGVELSAAFEVAALVLRTNGATVRAIHGPELAEAGQLETATVFEMSGVRIDESSRLAGLELKPPR